MSQIGKKVINIPAGLQIRYHNRTLEVKGPLGTQSLQLPSFLRIKWLGNPISQLILELEPSNQLEKLQQKRSIWGTSRTQINHLLQGVKNGFSIKLNLVGVGYRAHVESNFLVLKLGYSHLIKHKIPIDLNIQCIQPTIVLITGCDKQKVNQVAALIRSYRKPEPYKGKGIRYENEVIRLKEGKRT